MKLFDTHAHLLDEAFDPDRDAVIASLPGQGVAHVMECCCDEAGIDRVIELVERVPFFYGSAGVHPHSADEWSQDTAAHITRALQHERMLAVGEIGLDYHYDFSPRDVGSYELAKECIDLGLYVAFGGALTFKNAVRPIDVARRLPLDRLLIETDCPYMTPVPFRGQRNDPGRIHLTLEKMAFVRGEEIELLADALYRNALNVYEIAEL